MPVFLFHITFRYFRSYIQSLGHLQLSSEQRNHGPRQRLTPVESSAQLNNGVTPSNICCLWQLGLVPCVPSVSTSFCKYSPVVLILAAYNLMSLESRMRCRYVFLEIPGSSCSTTWSSTIFRASRLLTLTKVLAKSMPFYSKPRQGCRSTILLPAMTSSLESIYQSRPATN
jgi:hypothetical protein